MKMKKDTQEVPYLPEDLLPIDDFIQFCKEYGTDTAQDELALFEGKGFLKPCQKLDGGETKYAKHQLYPLRWVQKQQYFTVGRDSVEEDVRSILEREEHEMVNFKSNTREDVIREVVGAWNETAALINDIRLLSMRKNKRLQDAFRADIESGESRTEANRHMKQESVRIDELYEKDAKAIADKHGIVVGNLVYKRQHLMYEGTFGNADRAMMQRGYINAISNETFIKTEYTYMLIDQLSWLIYLLGEKQRTVKSLILQSIGPTCKYCSKSFEPIRGNQVTCGSNKCRKLNRNEHRRKQRRLANITSRK